MRALCRIALAVGLLCVCRYTVAYGQDDAWGAQPPGARMTRVSPPNQNVSTPEFAQDNDGNFHDV
jgi:hypothetical protein